MLNVALSSAMLAAYRHRRQQKVDVIFNASHSPMFLVSLLLLQISGAIIAPVSILFMMYAIYLYHKRTQQLLTRSTLRYDDARGPWMLTVLLIAVTLVVIILAISTFRLSDSSDASSGSSHHGGGGKLG